MSVLRFLLDGGILTVIQSNVAVATELEELLLRRMRGRIEACEVAPEFSKNLVGAAHSTPEETKLK